MGFVGAPLHGMLFIWHCSIDVGIALRYDVGLLGGTYFQYSCDCGRRLVFLAAKPLSASTAGHRPARATRLHNVSHAYRQLRRSKLPM